MKKPCLYIEKTNLILDVCRQKKVLHLGCVGFTDCDQETKLKMAGESLHAKLSERCNCTGVDLDEEAIVFFKNKFSNVILGNVERLEKLGLDLNSFDCVVAGDIIEHVSNPGLMLDGIRRLLKPDGVLIISTPHAFGLLPFLRHMFGRFVEGKQHVLTFNSASLQQLLERHGFSTISLDSCYQPQAVQNHPLGFCFGKTFFKIFPHLGGTLILVARLSS